MTLVFLGTAELLLIAYSFLFALICLFGCAIILAVSKSDNPTKLLMLGVLMASAAVLSCIAFVLALGAAML